MDRSMETCLTNVMGHLKFIDRYSGKDIPSLALAILIELNIPQHTFGFVYLLNAIELFCEDPFSSVFNGIYSKIVEAHHGTITEDQVEQAVRRALKKGWTKRKNRLWKLYFSTEEDDIMTMPTSQEFISHIGYLLILHTGQTERIRINEKI